MNMERPLPSGSRRMRHGRPVLAAPLEAESATGPLFDDPDLAVLVAAWPELPETVRVGIVAIVRAARDLANR